MSAIKSILVPVDFTPVAANAFDFALRLADDCPARIELLYCTPTELSSPNKNCTSAACAGGLKTEARENMAAFRRRGIAGAVNELTEVPKVHTSIEAGDPEQIIKEMVEAREVDLIVIGTNGQENPLEELVGSNRTYLIDEADVPILVVPNEVRYRALKQLCCVTDFEHLDHVQVIYLFELFAPFKPVADFVHVSTSHRKQVENMLRLQRRLVARPEINKRFIFTCLTAKEKVEEILHYARTSHADLLVMNRPHRGWFERQLKRSHTREAMVKTDLPLLILYPAGD